MRLLHSTVLTALLGLTATLLSLFSLKAQSGVTYEHGHQITSFVEPDRFRYDFDQVYPSRDGHLWFINMTSIYRYDGLEFERFDVASDTAVSNLTKQMSSMLQDRNGIIWIGTMGAGFVRYDPQTGEMKRKRIWPNDAVDPGYKTIVEDRFGGIWIGTDIGLVRVTDKANMDFELIVPSSPAGELKPIINSLESLCEVLAVPSNQDRTASFTLTDSSTSVLLFGMGHLIDDGDPLTMELADYGWLTNAAGDTIWKMDTHDNLYGKTDLNYVRGYLDLPAGEYALHFHTDESVAFGDWPWSLSGRPLPPELPEWYGIQLLKIDQQVENRFDQVWKSFPHKRDLKTRWAKLYQEEDGTIWVYGDGMQKLSVSEEGNYQFGPSIIKGLRLGKGRITHIAGLCTYDEDHLWVSGLDSLGQPIIGLMEKGSGSIRYLKTGIGPVGKYNYEPAFHTIVQDQHKNLWLGSFGTPSLHCLRSPHVFEDQEGTPDLQIFSSIGSGYSSIGSRNAKIKSLALDRNQNLWVATWTHYLHKIDLNPPPFQIIPTQDFGPGTVKSQSVVMDAQGDLWISQYMAEGPQSRLVRYTPPSGNYEIYQDSIGGLESTLFMVVDTLSGGKLLLYNYRDFIEIDPSTDTYHVLSSPPPRGLAVAFSHTVINDSILFLGREAKFYNILTGESIPFPNGYLKSIRSEELIKPLIIAKEPDNSFWISGMGMSQLGHFRWGEGGLELIEKSELFNEFIFDMLVTKDGTLWYGGNYSLCSDFQSGSMQSIWASNEVSPYILYYSGSFRKSYVLLEGRQDSIWIFSIRNGVGIFDAETNSVKHVPQFDGIRFHNSSKFDHWDGSITLIDSSNRFLYHFHPDSLKPDKIPPKMVFGVLSAQGNDSTHVYDLNWYDLRDRYEFAHDQNSLTIRYKGIHFNYPEGVRYQYRMQGSSNENWIDAGDKREASFFDLAPGSYTFSVKAMNADGYWSEPISLNVTILQPWWWTWIARIIYLLMAAAAAYGFYRFQLRRQLAEAEAQRLAELDSVKTRLYTNITHEFRTPLTVIQGMTEKVAERPERFLDSGIRMIRRNSRQLLRLVNQLLDLAKLESGHLQLNTQALELAPFLAYLVESFQSYAEMQGLALTYHSGVEDLHMQTDPDRLTDILSNLLSNAIKFTPAGGHITVDILREGDSLRLSVRDTGMGIAAEKLPYVFDRFYQADDSATRQAEGTGVGLALSRELVQLMGGSISVDSEIGTGSTFTVRLPITEAQGQAHLAEPSMEAATFSPVAEALPQAVAGEDRPRILIVEDNADVARYVQSCLEGDYQFAWAKNGQEGINMAFEQVPDLVISDVMMPEKDGFEVCYALKNDLRTSHIPVILLTARADVDSKLTGLRQGADAYLSKPFDETELRIRIENLLALRQTLQARYTQGSPPTEVPQAEGLEQEDAFIAQFRALVMDRLADANLDVSALSEALHLSRSPLHNKIKALTGMSTTEFVRHIRLTQAQELLRDPTLNVSEVSYAVGFQNHTYFSRKFRELTGMSPTEWRERA